MTFLTLPPTCFVAFVDETGHEQLRDKRHPVYGLGGCGLLAQDLESCLENPWRDVRQAVLGDREGSLHASALRSPSPAQIEVIARFFRAGQFCRFAAVRNDQTLFPTDFPLVRAVAASLKHRLVNVAKWTSFSEVAVVFEHSERATELLEQEFGTLDLEENGTRIPVNCFVMPKAAAQPALEVADFVMHAVGRQARQRSHGGSGFVPDFAVTFHEVSPRLVSFIEISRVTEGDALTAASDAHSVHHSR